jgi:hypothetical protein
MRKPEVFHFRPSAVLKPGHNQLAYCDTTPYSKCCGKINFTNKQKRSGVPSWVRKRPGLAVLVGAVGAIVFLEGFLRKAVESERGDRAFETRGGDAPGAVGAAPSGEVVALDPDQAFTHTSPAFACVWD